MEKQTALDKIDFVLMKRGAETHIKNVLESVKKYVEAETGFDYDLTMQYIESQMTGKLGGAAIYINKALVFLKNELKAEKKKEKVNNKQTDNENA